MDIDQLAPSDSKYMKKEEFATPSVLTIRSVAVEAMADGKQKAVLYFQEKAKGVVLNAGKKALLKAAFGGEVNNWVGRKVRLSLDPTVMMGTQMVGGIKLECSKAAPPAPVVAKPAIDIDATDLPF
jgi:hypothetical protein